jgi:hypothetical protein
MQAQALQSGVLKHGVMQHGVMQQCTMHNRTTPPRAMLSRRMHTFTSWMLLLALFISGLFISSASSVNAAELTIASKEGEREGEGDVDAITRAIMLGETPRALKLIRRMENSASANAGTLLDAAMLYCEAGQPEDAERVFSLLETSYAPPPAIQQLIEYTRKIGCARVPTPSPWKLSYGVSAGITDNANAGPRGATIRMPDEAPVRELTLLPSFVARADVFVGLEAVGEYKLNTANNLVAIGGLRARQYASETHFSYQQLLLGLGGQQRLGTQVWDGLLTGSLLMLGNSLYETALNLQAGRWWDVANRDGRPAKNGVDVLVSALQYPQNTSYDSYFVELRAKTQWLPREDTLTSATFGLVADISRNERVGGNRTGFMGGLRSETRLSETRQLQFHLQQYMLNDANIYNETLFGDLKRAPASGFLSVRLQQKLNLRDSVYIQLARNWRDDAIPLFNMKSHVLMVGYQW